MIPSTPRTSTRARYEPTVNAGFQAYFDANNMDLQYAGFVNDKAIGVLPAEKGVKVVAKKPVSGNKPASSKYSVNYTKSTRK